MSQFIALDMLPSVLTADELRRLVSIFPGVVRVELLADRKGRSLCSALIEASNGAYRDVIIQALDGLELFGQSLRASQLDVPEMAFA